MDDSCAIGYSVEAHWQAERQMASRLQYFRIQNTARKKRPLALDAQAWAGCIAKMDSENIEKTVSQEKQDKGKVYLAELKRQARNEENPGIINHKFL